VHPHQLMEYPLVSASSYILWNQNLSSYVQDTHNFFQPPNKNIARITLNFSKCCAPLLPCATLSPFLAYALPLLSPPPTLRLFYDILSSPSSYLVIFPIPHIAHYSPSHFPHSSHN
jgi:hypothetical protein